MSEKKPREFWLDICTPYGDPCDFINTKDPYDTDKHPVVSATNIHVIEKSAYDAVVADAKKDYDGMREFQMKFIRADHERIALAQRVKKLRAALEEAGNEIHNEFCSELHHKFCVAVQAALEADKEGE